MNRSTLHHASPAIHENSVGPLGEFLAATSRLAEPSPHRLHNQFWGIGLTDKLTGLANRPGFIALGEQQWKTARRTGADLVFVTLELAQCAVTDDITARDEAGVALNVIARTITRVFRRADIVCRWNGAEFRVLVLEAEGLNEPLLRARLELHLRNEGAPSGSPLALKGRITRIISQYAASFEEVLTILDRDLVESKRTWCGTSTARVAAAGGRQM
jgi:diguanylate cyclase (GGDEF)-like protein